MERIEFLGDGPGLPVLKIRLPHLPCFLPLSCPPSSPPSSPGQGVVQYLIPIRGCDDDDTTLVAVQSVHASQQLVQRLLHLVVGASQAQRALFPQRIQLIQEDDARRLLLSLLEEGSNPGGTSRKGRREGGKA
jgi:hypothetical protein